MRNHSIKIHQHATSISMEDEFWESVRHIAKERNLSIAALITEIDATRATEQNLSSAIRLHVLKFWQSKAKND